jgi:hypothetical protein
LGQRNFTNVVTVSIEKETIFSVSFSGETDTNVKETSSCLDVVDGVVDHETVSNCCVADVVCCGDASHSFVSQTNKSKEDCVVVGSPSRQGVVW